MVVQRFRLFGSGRPTDAIVGDVRPHETVTATIYVRRDPAVMARPDAARQLDAFGQPTRPYLHAGQAFASFSAAQDDLDAVEAFAKEHTLDVIERSASKRLVRVSGSAADVSKAFGVQLHLYKYPAGRYRSHEGDVHLPESLAGVVEGVLGLDNRKMVSTRPRPSKVGRAGEEAALPANAYTPPVLAKLFDFPAGNGTGQCVAVFAFNGQVMSTGTSTKGGYNPSQLSEYFTGTLEFAAAPNFTDVLVQGPGNDPGDGSEADDATGEVLLDLCTIGGVVPGADIVVYFTEFTEEGWVNAIKTAVADTVNKPSVISISYGNPEDDETKGLWSAQAVQLVNGAFEQAAAQGITICCASGDNGAGDEPETTTDHVDFPASSSWVLGCGGIRLQAEPATGAISEERVWNDLAEGEGASGGGVSRLFAVPQWQASAGVPANADGSGKTGRGVPDVASLADPQTPMWVLTPSGQAAGVGGTSAAAPLWAALIALLNELSGTRLGFVNPQLYAHLHNALVGIVKGDNGAYQAEPGWNACTGWGRPDGVSRPGFRGD